ARATRLGPDRREPLLEILLGHQRRPLGENRSPCRAKVLARFKGGPDGMAERGILFRHRRLNTEKGELRGQSNVAAARCPAAAERVRARTARGAVSAVPTGTLVAGIDTPAQKARGGPRSGLGLSRAGGRDSIASARRLSERYRPVPPPAHP